MRLTTFGLVTTACIGLLGCATSFYGSAPADDGHIYVVGGKVEPFLGVQPKVWRCPSQARGECVEVSVHE